jgi:hypothetical protein
LTCYAEDGFQGLFDLKLKQSTPGITLRKQQINLKEGTPKALLLAVTDPQLLNDKQIEILL